MQDERARISFLGGNDNKEAFLGGNDNKEDITAAPTATAVRSSINSMPSTSLGHHSGRSTTRSLTLLFPSAPAPTAIF